jgi:hypothetical protein
MTSLCAADEAPSRSSAASEHRPAAASAVRADPIASLARSAERNSAPRIAKSRWSSVANAFANPAAVPVVF